MKLIDENELEHLLPYDKLIPQIKDAFSQEYNIPLRNHHQYPNPKETSESTILLMPAWDEGKHLGVKIVTLSPNNKNYDLPSIQGLYVLFDLPTGTPIAMIDGKKLTTKRTAATSALASGYLSNPESKCLLMIGNGALAPELIKAHISVRPIKEVYLWGRNIEKSLQLIDSLDYPQISFSAIETLDEKIAEVDIISCATLSQHPLILGRALKPGQHLDMVGSFKPDMREMDDAAIIKADIYVDTMEGSTMESGDLVIPVKNGILTTEDIKAELSELVKGLKKGRTSIDQITCFKSVGHALEDLAAASLAYELSMQDNLNE